MAVIKTAQDQAAAYAAWVSGGRKGPSPRIGGTWGGGSSSTAAAKPGDKTSLGFLARLISGDISAKELTKDQINAIQGINFGQFNYNKTDLARIGLKPGDLSVQTFTALKTKLKGFATDKKGLTRGELARFTNFSIATLQKETLKTLEDQAAGLVPPPPKFGLARAGVGNASQAQFARLGVSAAPGVRSLIGTSAAGDPRFGRLKTLTRAGVGA